MLRLINRMGRFCLFLILIVLAHGAAVAVPTSASPERTVLILHSYSPDYPWTQTMHQAISTDLDRNEVSYFVEYMDSKRFSSDDYFAQLADLYRRKYRDIRIDGIIATDNNALTFALDHRQELFADAFICACGINVPESVAGDRRRAAIVAERLSYRETIAAALRQNPGTTGLTIISDATVSGRLLSKEAVAEAAAAAPELALTILAEEPFTEIRNRVAALEPGMVVYLLTFFRDSTGRNFRFDAAARELAAVSRVPIYVAHDFQMGTGVVGGDLVSAVHHGREAARLMLEHFKGGEVAGIHDQMAVTNRQLYDYNALARHGIAEDLLPAGSQLLFRPGRELPMLREDILTTIGLLLVAVLLIVLLSLNQAKKRVILMKSQALAETEARYRSLFEHSPVALMEADLSAIKGYLDELAGMGILRLERFFNEHPDALGLCASMIRIVDVNHAMRILYEAEKDQPLDGLLTVLPKGNPEGVREQILALKDKGRFIVVMEIATLAGNRRHVEQRGAIAAGYEDSWQKVYLSAVDITEQVTLKEDRQRLERQLQQSQKMEAIGSLAGGIAHDFNNLLSPIVGHAELLLAQVDNDSPLRQHCRGIVDGALRSRSLIRQILTFSKQVDMDIKPLRVDLVLDEALNLIRSTVPTNIEIERRVAPDLPMVLADPTEIHQVIMNLITNALHAMGQGGGRLALVLEKVDIGLEDQAITLSPGQYLNLRIADTGHGMDELTITRIFDPYFTTKGRGKGTGLGLAVVHGIIKGCGGDIKVYSEQGVGTEFKIFLPVVETRLQDEPEGPDKGPLELPRGVEHILLVDDEKSIIEVTSSMLTRLGYRVTARSSSHDGLAAFTRLHDTIDLVICDLTMPQMTGLQLYQRIKAICSDMGFILCTGFSEQLSDNQMLGVGISAFLNKPVIMSELAMTVRQVLDRRRV